MEPAFDDLTALRDALLDLPSSGPSGFEGLLATVFAKLLGVPFRLAKSGSQFGVDGKSADPEFPVAFEAKRYKDDVPSTEDRPHRGGVQRLSSLCNHLQLVALRPNHSAPHIVRIGNPDFKDALEVCNEGGSPNNISAVMRYALEGGATVMWLGDLETEFMEKITDHIVLEKTTIVFASHHGRDSGKIPDSWLEKLDPQIIVIGEAPSRHLHYYTGYKTITQNRAGDITMELVDNMVHLYVSNAAYSRSDLKDEGADTFDNYIGSIEVETDYTLEGAAA